MRTIRKELTITQFELIEDILSEIEEFQVYEGQDKKTLDELKQMFSYSEYKKIMEV